MKKRPDTHLSSPAVLKIALSLPLLAALLVACSPDREQAHQAAATTTAAKIEAISRNAPGAIDTSSTAPLDLSISPAMMQPLLEQDSDSIQAEILPAEALVIPARSKDDSRIRLTGELYYDDNAEDGGSGYLDAIDGGRLDIKIRFNG